MRQKISIRFANESDVPLILDFIKELASYEKLLNEVTATEQDLKKTLFGKHAYAKVIFTCLDEFPVGFAIFFYNYSTFLGKPGIYIEDLYVRKDARSQGLGKLMLSFLANHAKNNDFGRVEWWVLNWNQPAIDFYKKIGAKAMDEWTVFRLTGRNLDDLAITVDNLNHVSTFVDV